MATTNPSRFPTTRLPDCGPKSPCDPAPICPACGGLECLCRPRFFAGQLLTADDLNRLEEYIVAKNRLHNRYLVGWGVACGLEVVCNACDPGGKGSVIVKSGYALSPCGNDIIVCGDTHVNICDLIARCRPPGDMCIPTAPPGAAPPDDCAGGTEDWILGVCYTEKGARGVTALLNQSDPSKSACGCHSTLSGCGCGGAKKGKCTCGCGKKPPAKTPPPECEPTLTCESYSFAVWKAPKPVRDGRRWGAAATRFICCVRPFLTALGQYPANASADELAQWYFGLREVVREFLIEEGLYDCVIAEKLAAATLPNVSGANDAVVKSSVLQATYALLAIASLVIQKCLCAALLPPCPEMAETDCVPLATITVRRRPCQVVKICNISARKFLITIPNIQYWLSFFTMFQASGANAFDSLRQLLERLCCTDLERWVRGYTASAGDVFAAAAPAPAVAAGAVSVEDANKTESPFASMLYQALATPGRDVNPATLMLAAMGAHDRNGRPLATDAELADPAEFLLINQIVAPMVRAMIPGSATAPLGGAFAAAASQPDAGNLAREVNELKKTVAKQQKTIDQLKRRK
jgi:hypothetical protein